MTHSSAVLERFYPQRFGVTSITFYTLVTVMSGVGRERERGVLAFVLIDTERYLSKLSSRREGGKSKCSTIIVYGESEL